MRAQNASGTAPPKIQNCPKEERKEETGWEEPSFMQPAQQQIRPPSPSARESAMQTGDKQVRTKVKVVEWVVVWDIEMSGKNSYRGGYILVVKRRGGKGAAW